MRVMDDTFGGAGMKTIAGAYSLAGIALASELAIPELIPSKIDVSSAVTVRLGTISAPPDGLEAIGDGCWANSSRYVLSVPGVAQYEVSHGREIVIDPDVNAPAVDVRGYLLGTIFVVLCHQRGLLPLHASAVRSVQGVVAFLGRSGDGKSSLAAQLSRRGFPVVSDDICLVDAPEGFQATVAPAAPWLKLWRNSLDHLGTPAEGLERVFSDDDKYRLPLEQSGIDEKERTPLHRLVFLERRETSEGAAVSPEIQEISRLEAIPMLMNLTHHSWLIDATGQRKESFLRCGRVLSRARAYRLVRTWGFEHMDRTLETLEAFLNRMEG